MGGVALLARAMGHEVSGSDENVYPPMSHQLSALGIQLMEGYHPSHIQPAPDLVIIGNTLSRGNPAVEYVLDKEIQFSSGPQWLEQELLQDRHVLAVSGTHGKTTTTSILAWLLESAELNPGFLVGGIAENFGQSARYTESGYFVVEADEYDTAFFDKRSKFIHYRPKTLIINNIEFDHADIFHDLAAILREFHHLIRILPGNGRIIAKCGDTQIKQVLEMGCWTPVETFAADGSRWNAIPQKEDYSRFEVTCEGQAAGIVNWSLLGRHNAENALAAIAAAAHVNIPAAESCAALADFKNVKRRLEKLAVVDGVSVYDDFAHHPTEIKATLEALRRSIGDQRITAIMEPRSNTMRMGIHQDTLAASFTLADRVLLFQPEGLSWDLSKSTAALGTKCKVYKAIEAIVDDTTTDIHMGEHIVIMSNGGFDDIHNKLIEALASICE
jgi:UDP-N-acetylmuramate: L-alanyl-gamma-D-glutamyl-meso-diaminopimelate ligase